MDMPLILKAAYLGELDTITDLIQGKGLDPCLTNSVSHLSSKVSVCAYILHLQEGTQAIHFAAEAGHLHIVKALVEHHGVPPDACNNVRSGYCEYKCFVPKSFLLYRFTISHST